MALGRRVRDGLQSSGLAQSKIDYEDEVDFSEWDECESAS
jgi:hypothetical protein